jgi:GT2 family glycosyltransferase
MQSDLEALLFHRESIPQGTSSTMLVRRDVFDSIGGYDESLSTVADWDLLIRLRLQTLFCYVSEAQVLYRRHGSSMSRNVQLLAEESGRVLDKAFKAPELPLEMRGLRGHCLAWNDLVLSGCYFWGGRPGRAMHFAARAVWRDPRLVGRILGFPGRQVRRLWNREPRPGIV